MVIFRCLPGSGGTETEQIVAAGWQLVGSRWVMSSTTHVFRVSGVPVCLL